MRKVLVSVIGMKEVINETSNDRCSPKHMVHIVHTIHIIQYTPQYVPLVQCSH